MTNERDVQYGCCSWRHLQTLFSPRKLSYTSVNARSLNWRYVRLDRNKIYLTSRDWLNSGGQIHLVFLIERTRSLNTAVSGKGDPDYYSLIQGRDRQNIDWILTLTEERSPETDYVPAWYINRVDNQLTEWIQKLSGLWLDFLPSRWEASFWQLISSLLILGTIIVP